MFLGSAMPPILRLAKAETLECQIRRRQLKLLGHVLRKDASDADRLCCFQPNTPLQPCVPPGCRRRVRRSRLVWAETILPVCERYWNLCRIQSLQLAQNRTAWHSATLYVSLCLYCLYDYCVLLSQYAPAAAMVAKTQAGG